MSFSDNPIVDLASKNSEESVNAVRCLFTRKNGFITRKEDPDYGVDEDVELMIDNQASSKKFAIQIKSVVKANFIKTRNNDYVSLQFKSSRLGYLCRRPPAYGIIIIYDDSSQVSYFDYVNEICNRLNDQNNNDDWKKVDKPTIHIPISNILNNESIKAIHEKMVGCHKNNQFLLTAFGGDYNIPVYQDNITNDKIDFNNPKVVAEFLSDNGLRLFNHNDLSFLQSLISKLTLSDLLKSKELSLLSSIINCETGNFIDADYFLKKSFSAIDFNADQKNLWSFTRYKTDFALGNYEYKDYLVKLEELSKAVKGNFNDIVLKINIVFLKLLISNEERKFNENLIEEIDHVFDLIFNLSIDDEKKYNLINYHSFNLHMYATSMLIDKMGKIQIKKTLNIFVPLNQRINDVKSIVDILGLPTKYTFEALSYANKNDNRYIRATSLYQLSHYFLMLQLTMFNHDEITPFTDEISARYKKNIEYSSFAYNEFVDLNIYKDGYNALTLTYELLQLYKASYQKTIDSISIAETEHIIREYCKEFGLNNYTSIVTKALEAKESNKENDFQSFLKSNENNIDEIADSMISGIGIPIDRKKNVLCDLENHQYFFKNRASEDYEIQQDLRHTFSLVTYYCEKPRCLIECKKCGFKTHLSINIKELMNTINNHKCKN
jgi:hypothetical protein